MSPEQIYEIDWSGIGSNAFTILCCALLTIGFFLSLRTIFRAVIDLIKHRSPQGLWEWTSFTLLVWLALIVVAVKGALAARSRRGGSALICTEDFAALNGFSRSAQPRSGRWLAISIVAAPTFAGVFTMSVLKEQPMRLAISSDRIELIYRLPWRDKSISMANVTGVRLDRHDFMNRAFPDYFYVLVIQHGGEKTLIQCNHRAWYEHQLQAAFETIRSYLNTAREKNETRARRMMPTTAHT